jgi:hypothetical protein
MIVQEDWNRFLDSSVHRYRCLRRSSPEPDDWRPLFHAQVIRRLARPAFLAFQDIMERDDIAHWFPHFCFLAHLDAEKFTLRSG